MNKSTENKPDKNLNATKDANQPIDASDATRNDERDQRIKEEPGTARLRSERESTKNQDSE